MYLNYSSENNKKRMKKYKNHGTKVINKASHLVLRAVIAFVLIAVVAVAGAGIGFYFSVIEGAQDVSTLPRGIIGGELDSVILDAHGNEIARLDAGVNRTWAEWDDISQYLKDAIVAIEDERFFEHNGVDMRSMGRAVYETFLRGNQQGGSTITQQLIKNQIGLMRNSVESKLQEQVMAVQFETMLVEELGSVEAAKQHILLEYMNIIYLGGGNNGVQAASMFYFGKNASELTLSEAAVIAGITQFPWSYNPSRFPENNRYRKANVLDAMLRLGKITESQHREALEDDVYDRIQAFRSDVDPNEHIWSYFTEAVIAQLRDDLMEQQNLTRDQANHRIFHDGLTIYSTMIPEIQEIVDREYLNEANFPTNARDFEYTLQLNVDVRNTTTGRIRHAQRTSAQFGQRITNPDMFDTFIEWALNDIMAMDDVQHGQYRFIAIPQPQSSMVVIDHNNGRVVAMAGQRGEKQANRQWNRATQATRQPGSVFKIFASFAPAIDLGMITAATAFDDTPNIIFDYGLGRHRVWPQNWWAPSGATPYRGHTTVRRAIEQSYNIVAVKNWNYVGGPVAFNYLQNFGFTTLDPSEANNAAAVLGGLNHGVTTIELTAAMGAIANGGILHQPILYTQVLDREGNIVIDNRALEPTQVINRDTAYLLTDMMRDVMRGGGTGTAANWAGNMDVAGKTGTTQNGRDVYFVGYTPYFTAGVWVGHDVARNLSLIGGRPDVRIFSTVMRQIHQDLEVRRFERPPGFVTAQICIDSGGIPTAACHNDPRGGRIRSEIFIAGTAPMISCHIHFEQEVEIITGLLPDPQWTPADQIETRTFIRRDRSWLEVAGNVSITDAWLEAPTQVSTFFNPFADYDYYDIDHGPPDDDYDEPVYGYWGEPEDEPAEQIFAPDNPVTQPPTQPQQTEPPTLPFTLPNIDRSPIQWPDQLP